MSYDILSLMNDSAMHKNLTNKAHAKNHHKYPARNDHHYVKDYFELKSENSRSHSNIYNEVLSVLESEFSTPNKHKVIKRRNVLVADISLNSIDNSINSADISLNCTDSYDDDSYGSVESIDNSYHRKISHKPYRKMSYDTVESMDSYKNNDTPLNPSASISSDAPDSLTLNTFSSISHADSLGSYLSSMNTSDTLNEHNTSNAPNIANIANTLNIPNIPNTLNAANIPNKLNTLNVSNIPNTLNTSNIPNISKLSKDDNFLDRDRQKNLNILNKRIKCAKDHHTNDINALVINNKYMNMYFSKGIFHDSNGFVNETEMIKLIDALRHRDYNKLSSVKLSSDLKFVNPSAAWSSDIIGACSNTYRYRQPKLNYIEMIELYCMSLTRDIPFSHYVMNTVIDECCKNLNLIGIYSKYKEKYLFDKDTQIPFNKVTSNNIFRGPMCADIQGSYISQFLYRDIRIGGMLHKQKYLTDLEGHDYMKTWENAISCQNGKILEKQHTHRDTPRYIITGRDLASVVHNDDVYQIFNNTCLILLDMGVKLIESCEYNHVNMGKADILASLAMIGRNALLAASYVKWNSLILRPEALGIEVERCFREKNNKYDISSKLLNSPMLRYIKDHNTNCLLTQVYSEGSPLSPSNPSDHAVIAGACCTVLKFFFNTQHEFDVIEPDASGNQLSSAGKKTTVEDEINKLACNVCFGRMWAGVNYRMDAISGLKLGQKVAISCLKDLVNRYPINVRVDIIKFNDEIVTISNY